MSGTSLDGIDAVLVEINGNAFTTKLQLHEFITWPIPEEIKLEIQDCFSIERSSVQLITSLNFKMGYLFAEAVKQVCNQARIPLTQLDFIASHGQTVFHIPTSFNRYTRSTLQLGEPAVIAYETRTQVVSNFRTMDMAAGGEGAPLVPYSEFLLYRSNRGRIIQNIGGIANATVIKADANLEDVIAFDTGPGNMIIDEMCKRYTGKSYDTDGQLATKGKVQPQLLDECMQHPFIRQPPPKSTGREMFGSEYVLSLLNQWRHLSIEDLLATMTMFTARSIVDNYKRFIFPTYSIQEVILGGGGAYNATLVKMIKQLLPNQQVLTQEDLGFSSAAKEAIAMVILANETLHGQPSNVIGATGAKRPVILGNITPVPF
ncbi:anhydro-N-acetylmuramic acid kinase [Thermoflavimicrobium daqui]|jgi:anhydro-N-acetylmuramic acid kinase|uniref:Anhydro-N-acetylmuramic acid kinase n=2 Tax=Thermoflavimicrobium daqui TaxID=2137476 RepID=A0A364K0E7_9BACL|nr:anhydro-N-acetylmuramic acid kinase [Thermoflavimicrobium daqui]